MDTAVEEDHLVPSATAAERLATSLVRAPMPRVAEDTAAVEATVPSAEVNRELGGFQLRDTGRKKDADSALRFAATLAVV